MSKKHLIPDGLSHRDVERFHQCIPPPLSLIPTKREESTGNLTTVKVKISNSLMGTVAVFASTDPESYIKLMDQLLD